MRKWQSPEAIYDVLVVEEKDLLIGKSYCCQLEAP